MKDELLNYLNHRNAPLPKGPWLMYQKWEKLLCLHIPVDAAEILPHVPNELELDLYKGDAWISIFPFKVKNLQIRGLPKPPFIHDFLELNVRTYVKYKNIPGIYFFSLDAEKIIPVIGARLGTLPYYKAEITKAGTLDYWLFERYYLFNTIGSKIISVGIHHLPWQPAQAAVTYEKEALNSLLPGNLKGEAVKAHYVRELEVIFWLPGKI